MVEVFTKPDVDPEAAKQYIFEKTGMVPAIYDKGTHYVTSLLLLDMPRMNGFKLYQEYDANSKSGKMRSV